MPDRVKEPSPAVAYDTSTETPLVMARLDRDIRTMDRSFDIAYWQAQSSGARIRAIWELVVFAHEMKGGHRNELRFDRTVGSLQRRER